MSIHSPPRIEALLALTIRVKWIITKTLQIDISIFSSVEMWHIWRLVSSYLNRTLLEEKEHNLKRTLEPGDSWKLQQSQNVAYPSTILVNLDGEDIGPWQTLGLLSLMYNGPVSAFLTSFTEPFTTPPGLHTSL